MGSGLPGDGLGDGQNLDAIALSPELNRIERLWHKVKHTWLVPKCRDKQTLEADVEEIMDNLGFKYQFAFY